MSAVDIGLGRILIIDDEPANVELLGHVLRREGYDIVTSSDSREALERFFEEAPDLVLLDLRMPHVDGFELLEAIRDELPEEEFVPIVVLTADVSTEARHRALDAGATDFLTKPLDAIEVRLRVRNLLRTRRLHLEVQGYKDQLERRLVARTVPVRAARSEAGEEE